MKKGTESRTQERRQVKRRGGVRRVNHKRGGKEITPYTPVRMKVKRIQDKLKEGQTEKKGRPKPKGKPN